MAKTQIGLKLEPALIAELDREAGARGLTRTQGVEAPVPKGAEVRASGVTPAAPDLGKVTITPTPKAPPPGGGRVSQIDLPVGRERPAYGSRLKGAGKGKG